MVLLVPPHPNRQGQAGTQSLEVAHDAARRVDCCCDALDQLADVGLGVLAVSPSGARCVRGRRGRLATRGQDRQVEDQDLCQPARNPALAGAACCARRLLTGETGLWLAMQKSSYSGIVVVYVIL